MSEVLDDLDLLARDVAPALNDRHWAKVKALIAELRASRKVVEAFRRDLASLTDDFVATTEALQEYDERSLLNVRNEEK